MEKEKAEDSPEVKLENRKQMSKQFDSDRAMIDKALGHTKLSKAFEMLGKISHAYI